MDQASRRSVYRAPYAQARKIKTAVSNVLFRSAYWLERWMLGSFVVWFVVIGTVIGPRAANTGNLFNQTSFWDLYFKRFYRKFTDASCDRSTSGCPSTIEFAVPQSEISGVTIFMWFIVAPLVAFFFQNVVVFTVFNYFQVTDVVSMYKFRAYNEVVYVLFVAAELFLLAYMRSAAGETSLASFFAFAGVWTSLRLRELIYSDTLFASKAFWFVNSRSDVEAAVKQTLDMKPIMAILEPWSNWDYPLESAMRAVFELAPFVFMWTAYFLPIGTAWSYGGTRYSYTLAYWLFFMFHLLESELFVRKVYMTVAPLKVFARCWSTSVAPANGVKSFEAFQIETMNYYSKGSVIRVVMWLAKMLSAGLVLFWWDVAANSGTIVQFNLLA